MTDSPVQFRLVQDVALLAFDDGKANALTMGSMDALDQALDRARAEAKAVVIAGRAGRFCAGFDLSVMTKGPQEAMRLVGRGGELLLRIYAHPQPVVAACTGHAVAGGALLLLACDTRVGAAGDFKLGLNETAIDMALPLLGREFARDRLLPTRLTEATIQARLYDPQVAVEVGYLDRVVAPERAVDEALAAAEALTKLSIRAYGITKQQLRRDTIAKIRANTSQDFVAISQPSAS
jgi:enoyl-CoA hydratase